ncbi:SMP-30/gluconolactonase/LRE family protein [Saccharopolyspora gregorii]|uniref:SMP-30/Gluconolactonase/LRE-like region domain-containing protein n=1 Tax=Saccharopolyspora gregorii TaxID=33914 RepID=A0ABP6S362_9PSEU
MQQRRVPLHDRDGLSVPGGQPDDYSGGRLQRVTLDGEVTDVCTEVDGRPLRGPNDLVFGRRRRLLLTDFGKTARGRWTWAGLYYALPDGSRVEEMVFPLHQPNGVGLSPDGDRVHVAETGSGRVWSWEVLGPADVRRGAELLHGFSGGADAGFARGGLGGQRCAWRR